MAIPTGVVPAIEQRISGLASMRTALLESRPTIDSALDTAQRLTAIHTSVDKPTRTLFVKELKTQVDELERALRASMPPDGPNQIKGGAVSLVRSGLADFRKAAGQIDDSLFIRDSAEKAYYGHNTLTRVPDEIGDEIAMLQAALKKDGDDVDRLRQSVLPRD